MPARFFLALAWLVAAGVLTDTQAAEPQSLGEKVAEFCKSHKGEQVGNGECAALAGTALKESGGHGRGKDSPNKDDYTWGELVLVIDRTQADGKADKGKPADLKPGDIIQFRDTKWSGPRRGKGGTYSQSFPHHTAVIAAVEEKGSVVHIYHQNFGGKKVVMDATLYPADLKEGWIRVYRPVPK